MLCKKCGATDPDSFYKGIATFCRKHWKEKVRENRKSNADHYLAYEKSRAMAPHRVAARTEYQMTERGLAAMKRAKAKYAATEMAAMARKRYLANHPEKRAAHTATSNAIRDGRLQRTPCFVCGDERVEAHHPDYGQPLQVVWLCVKHHAQTHVEHRERMLEGT